MTPPPPRHNWIIRAFTAPVLRWVTWLATLILVAAIIGHWTAPTIGGIGPALLWLGILVSPTLSIIVVVALRILERYPQVQPGLEALGRAGSLAACIGLSALAVLELQYRESHPIPAMQFQTKDPLIYLQRPDPVLGWRSAKNYSIPMDFLSGTRKFTTNSRGFRDIEQQPDQDRPRVVIIGDSFPLGWGGDIEDSITPLLRQVLPEAQIFNASWQAYTKDQIHWSYQELARPLRPTVVLMMMLTDPFRDTSLPLYFGLRKPYNLLDGDRLIQGGTPVSHYNNAKENQAYYMQWQSRRVTDPVSAWRFLTRDFIPAHSAFGRQVLTSYEWQEANELGMPPIDAIESKIMAKLKSEVEADGAHLIVVPAPRLDIFQLTSDPVQAMQRHLDGYRALGIDTVDITPLLLKNWPKCFNGDKHPTALAIKRIHKAVADRIRAYISHN